MLHPMKCSNCGRDGLTLTTLVNMSTGQTSYLCPDCQAAMTAEQFNTPEELDEMIRGFEDLASRFENLIINTPEMPEVPPEISAFAFTPLSAYQAVQANLAKLKGRRMELLTQAGSEERLNYELKKALEAEDYEKSALLRDELKKKKSTKE